MDKENNAAPAAAAAQPQQKPLRQGNRRRKKVCAFCAAKIEHVDYKDIARLSKCISERAKILPRRINGTWRTSPASAYSCRKDGTPYGSSALHQRLINSTKCSVRNDGAFFN